jgi:hypothetical protein
MTREPLQRASEILQEASESASGEVADRLEDQASAFATHAESERGPDHGRLARHENHLHELEDDVDDDVRALIEDAFDAIHDYRETIEGV